MFTNFQDLPETTQANYEQNMQDAMAVMHKLQTGIDVNVKFTGYVKQILENSKFSRT